jgi:hypothetical protein
LSVKRKESRVQEKNNENCKRELANFITEKMRGKNLLLTQYCSVALWCMISPGIFLLYTNLNYFFRGITPLTLAFHIFESSSKKVPHFQAKKLFPSLKKFSNFFVGLETF